MNDDDILLDQELNQSKSANWVNCCLTALSVKI